MATCRVCGPLPDDVDVDEHMGSASHRSMVRLAQEMRETIYTPARPDDV